MHFSDIRTQIYIDKQRIHEKYFAQLLDVLRHNSNKETSLNTLKKNANGNQSTNQ